MTYSAHNINIFASVLGAPTMALGGASSASVWVAPNINFYLLLDNSSSMELPATQAGINAMIALTPQQTDGGWDAGCAYACHELFTNENHFGDTAGNPCAKTSGGTTTYTTPTLNYAKSGPGNAFCAGWQGTQIDNYQLARNNNITLKLDVLTSAVCCSSDLLMYTASAAQNSSPNAVPPVYQFAVYSMDTLWSVPGTTPGVAADNNLVMGLTKNYVTAWNAASANFGVVNMYENNYLCATAACDFGVEVAGQGDVTTNYDVALNSINATMPDPGNGTNAAGDTPQEVLFFVTDGVEDKSSGGTRYIQQINGSSIDTNYCTTIKNRGIRIAVLYTTYLELPTDYYYKENVAPFQLDIAPALQAWRRRACSIKPRSATTLERI